MSTADHAAPTTLELVRLCHEAVARIDRTPPTVEDTDNAFFVGYLFSSLLGLTGADPSDPHARVEAARAIAVYISSDEDAYTLAELAFSGMTDSTRRRLADLLELVGL